MDAMKPRLVSLPLTSEDVMIWRRWRRHVGDPWYGRLRIEYGAADIRDGDLMLHAQSDRSAPVAAMRDGYGRFNAAIDVRGGVQWLELYDL